MKLCNAQINGRPFVGVITEGGIVNITALGFPERMNDIIVGGDEMLNRVRTALSMEMPPVLDEKRIQFLPVTEPKKIICVGLNYEAHAREGGGKIPDYPIYFSKFNDSLSAHNQPVTLPPWLSKYDYEAELVIVMGRHAHNVSVEDAEVCIFGYTCGNDLSARDAQFLSSQWLPGKSLPGFAPIGPYILTRDCFDPYESNRITCELNGVTVQSADTKDMVFKCFEAVSTASRFFPLSPGDVIFTGTPEGVILGRPKGTRVWLKPGDIVTVSIDGIGSLTTPLE